MKIVPLYIVAFICSLTISSLVPQEAVSEMTNTPESKEKAEQKTGLTDRKAEAYEIFEEILVLTETADMKDAFPKIESLYFKIIAFRNWRKFSILFLY